MSILFRWSIWGDKKHLIETLPHSIRTFRRAFTHDARFVVCTDEPAALTTLVGDGVDILPYGHSTTALFNIDAKATWKKWCPTPRLDPASTEFYVDSDVFLVGDPTELRRFSLTSGTHSYLAFREAPGSPHKIGMFGPRILQGIPPINTGFLGQRPGADITNELLGELRWWIENVPIDQRQYHDDQGAVVAVLARYYLLGLVDLLPQDRYLIVSPISNAHIRRLEGVVAIHATYPNHPAFHRFRRDIDRYLLT